MSRIGKKPVPVPAGVEVKVDSASISVKGKHGDLSFTFHPSMKVELDSETNEINVTRPDDARQSRALHGLTRALVANMVQGVETPFVRKLEIQGVGYQASLNGNKLSLQVGFANTIVLEVPQGVICELPNSTNIVLTSADKHAVGQFAANIRSVRPPEPYKGKGIRYEGEYVRRKAGKAFAN
ncbi:50S ribosomal protein L6 [Gimesia sp.]|uniref:50S ribosomal protein L6 n=1 Tax=Gimesia sp. TaxID=2024833 RepID=UPI000C69DC67|nr:50S ribosomal protein L6 [Gimesia sp.]MAX36029.1 50S ribosomal protein L6 [Gimesia sp.]HAH46959.1 50S ribosomal protein L6 [Planctomycetaceae bacterium]|tara:strand:+ start:9102 stop:9647 length:546 start_codon:yes stop_codon:yes gene_type:complete